MTVFRKAYAVVGALLFVEYLAQAFLIATALFTHTNTFGGFHPINGALMISVTTLVMIAFSIGARHPGMTVLLTASLFLLLSLQFVLAIAGSPLVSGFDGLNALILIGAAGWLSSAHWAWRSRAVPRSLP